jgi:hypothetical protein
MQIQDGEKRLLETLPESNPFSVVFKVAGDTAGLEKGLETPLARDLAISAGHFGEYLAKKATEGELGIQSVLMREGRLHMLDDIDGPIIKNLLLDANAPYATVTQKWLLGLGGAIMSQSERSAVSGALIDRYALPLRRASIRMAKEAKDRYAFLTKGAEKNSELMSAMGYSDQFGKLLSREELQLKFKLGNDDTVRYYQLHRLFKGMWDDLNQLEGNKLTTQGFKILKDSDLDGHGQRTVLKELPIRPDKFPAIDVYSMKAIVEGLPPKVGGRIQAGVNEGEFQTLTLLNDLRVGKLKAYETYDVGTGLPQGVEFLADALVASPKGERVVAYNPGFFGGVTYANTPVSVIALHPAAIKAINTGVKPSSKPVLHLYRTRYIADANNFLNKHKLVKGLKKRGYEFMTYKQGQSPDEAWASFNSSLASQIGDMPAYVSAPLAKKLGGIMHFSDEQVDNLMTLLTRPALAPHLQNRATMLKGKTPRWATPGFQKGRLVWKKDGTQVVRPDLLPILNTEQAGLEYIRRYANTMGKGHFRDILKEQFAKHYSDFVGPSGNVFAKLVYPRNPSKDQARLFIHARAVQTLLKRLYDYPTAGEKLMRDQLFQKAELYSAQAGDSYLGQIGSKMLDELGIAHRFAVKVKTVGSGLIFMGSVGIFVQQLMPALNALHAKTQIPWLNKMLVEPMLKSKRAPIRFGGALVDALNMNPVETAKIIKDVPILALSWANRSTTKRPMADLFAKGRNKQLDKELFDSGILLEMKSLEEIGDIRSRFMDAAFATFYLGEGTSRLFSWAAARRSMEREYEFALKQARKGKSLTTEEAKHTQWFSIAAEKDAKGKVTGELALSREGMIEAQKRATDLFLNFTKEDAPWASQGISGVWAQYTVNIAAQIKGKYIFGNGFSAGQKLRMAIVNAAAFGTGGIYFAEDIIAVPLMLNDMYQNLTWPRSKAELVSEFHDFAAGYVAAVTNSTARAVRKAMDGGFVQWGLNTATGLDEQWNISNRLISSAMVSDWIGNNLYRLSAVAKAIGEQSPGKAISEVTKLAPATKVISGQGESFLDTITALKQLSDRMDDNANGYLDIQRRAWKSGNEEAPIAAEIDNVRRQAVKNLPGAARWTSFLDTYGVNAVGATLGLEEGAVWQTAKGRPVDPENPYVTRWQLLSGLGPAYQEESMLLRDIRRDKSQWARDLGRDAAKTMQEGNYDEGDAKLQALFNNAAENPEAALYLQEAIDSWAMEIFRNTITPKTERDLERAKATGRVSPSVMGGSTIEDSDLDLILRH